MRKSNIRFKSPLSKGYFAEAAKEFSDIRSVATAAVLCAFAIVLKLFDLQLSEIMRVSLTFVPIALCSALTGPVMAIPCGIIVDIVGYVVHPTGAYIPGYTLSAILTALIYALFLYRTNVGFTRIALSKLCTSVLVNVLLGSVWRIFISGDFYLYYVCVAAVKNAFLFPIEVVLLCLVFSALSRPLKSFGISVYNGKLKAKHIVILVMIAFISAASVILFTLYYNTIVAYIKNVLAHP